MDALLVKLGVLSLDCGLTSSLVMTEGRLPALHLGVLLVFKSNFSSYLLLEDVHLLAVAMLFSV